jgi:hypothetical protein
MNNEERQLLEDVRYSITYALSSAITRAIRQTPPGITHKQAYDIYREWCDEEDGNLAITRLVNLILY